MQKIEFTAAEAVTLKNAIRDHFKGFNYVIDWKRGQIIHTNGLQSVVGHIGHDFDGRPYVSDVSGDSDELVISLPNSTKPKQVW